MAKKQRASEEVDSTRTHHAQAPLSDTQTGAPDPQFRDLLSRLPKPTDLVGPYELIRELGRGGMGQVWLAQHATNRRLVALKLLHKEKFDSIERYLLVRREIEAQANLDHSHIVSIVDVGLPALHQEMSQEDILERLRAEPMYVAFEYVEDARTLRDLIQGDRLPHEQVAELIRGVADALDCAHGQGVYHLDVKPLNVLIDRDNKPLLADFGLSTLKDGDTGTRSGGTPMYMSPERLRSLEHRDASGDIWSLGVTFYELLTHKQPFQQIADVTNEEFHYRAIQEVDHTVPPLFIELCDSCLERDPKLRCQSAQQVAARLQTWLDARQARTLGKALIGFAALSLLLVLTGIGYGVARLTGLVGGVDERVSDVEQGVQSLAQKVEQGDKTAVAEIQKLYEDPDVLTGKLKSHIRQRANEQIAKAKANKSGWRKIDEIEKRRDAALDGVDHLVATIREGLAGDPDPVFAEAARLLVEQGVDEAIEYLNQKEPDLQKRVKRLERRRDQAEQDLRDALQSWLLKAALHETHLAFDAASDLYETVAEKTPTWSIARRKLGELLDERAEFVQAELHLKAALELADNEQDRALATNSLGLFYLHRARYGDAESLFEQYLQLAKQLHAPDRSHVATSLSNLGLLFFEMGRLVEAEPLMRGVLKMAEQSDGPEHSKVALYLNNLAQVLHGANRLKEAEALMRRALEINEQVHGTERPEIARDLGNLATLLHTTNRLAEAEALMRRALAIDEQFYGTLHPKTAMNYNNLATVIQATGRLKLAGALHRRSLIINELCYGAMHPQVANNLNNLATTLHTTNVAKGVPLHRAAVTIAEQTDGTDHRKVGIYLSALGELFRAANLPPKAEPLLRRALAIGEQAYEDEHPVVATHLNNMALLLQATNRLAEAEPLARHALAIDERSYGAEHSDVARDLHNLALVFLNTNRLSEAEPLSRRVLEILALFAKSTGHEHPYAGIAERNYLNIVNELKLDEDEIGERMAAIAEVERPLKPIVPEIDQLLGPAMPVVEVLARLDQQYKKDNKPAIYFLPLDEPMSPQLDGLLGPSELSAQSSRTLAEQIDELLGPATLALPIDEPISPHLNTLLGSSKLSLRANKPIADQLDKILGPSKLDVPLDQPVSPLLDQLIGSHDPDQAAPDRGTGAQSK